MRFALPQMQETRYKSSQSIENNFDSICLGHLFIEMRHIIPLKLKKEKQKSLLDVKSKKLDKSPHRLETCLSRIIEWLTKLLLPRLLMTSLVKKMIKRVADVLSCKYKKNGYSHFSLLRKRKLFLLQADRHNERRHREFNRSIA